jgi:hypothetical protein
MKTTLFFAILAFSIHSFAVPQNVTLYSNRNGIGINDNLKQVLLNPSNAAIRKTIEKNGAKNPWLYREFDSIYSWNFDTITGWRFDRRSINMVYDASHNLTNYTEQGWNGNIVTNFWQYLYTYNSSNNLTSYIVKNWNTNRWDNYAENEYFYDTTTNNLIEEHQRNGLDTNWYMYSKYLYNYDYNNNLVYKVWQFWSDSTWTDRWHYSYAYDSNNNRINEVWQTMTGGVWKNYLQAIYSYDLNNNLTIIQQQDWVDSLWVNEFLAKYTYDTNNNETSWVWQVWDINNNIWRNEEKDLYTYDANNFNLSDLTYAWGINGDQRKNDSTHYYFHTNVGITENGLPDENIIVHPNPTSGIFEISSETPITVLKIFNVFGDCVYSDCNFSQSNPIDLSKEAKGIYFLQISCGKKDYSRKVIIH